VIEEFKRITDTARHFMLKCDKISMSKFDTAMALILHPLIQKSGSVPSPPSFEEAILQLCIHVEFLSKLRSYVNSADFKATQYFAKNYPKEVEQSILGWLELAKVANEINGKRLNQLLLVNKLTNGQQSLFFQCDKMFLVKIRTVLSSPVVALVAAAAEKREDSAKSTPTGIIISKMSTNNNTPVQTLLVKRNEKEQPKSDIEEGVDIDLEMLLGKSNKRTKMTEEVVPSPPPVEQEEAASSEHLRQSNLSFGPLVAKEDSFAPGGGV
jgi:hypothetical protein